MKKVMENDTIYQHEYDQASNAYLMSVVGVIAGLPLPVINVIASLIYYSAYRNSSYFVRWHCIQAIIAQALIIPFNSIAFAWTLSFIFRNEDFTLERLDGSGITVLNLFSDASLYYWLYIFFVIILNIIEFFAVIYTASQVRNKHSVRWAIISKITDYLCSKENRDIYKI